MPVPLLDFCRAEQPWLIDLIRRLVARESPTGDAAAVDACGAELAAVLEAIGARVERLPTAGAGHHLKASIGDGGRQVLLLGHFDTIWPIGQLERMPLVEREGRLHGPGIFDMKAGLALAILAARAVLAQGPLTGTRLVMLWTTDEETGSATSRPIIEEEARKSDVVLVFEPSLPGGALKTSRKGVGQFEVVAHGVSAHAGLDPGKGVNAVKELAHQVLAIDRLQDPARGATVSVGIVEGGTRVNVVPAEARAVVDARAVTRADAARLEAQMTALSPVLPGARVEVRGGFDRPPLERDEGVARLYALASEVAGELGIPIAEGAAGGGSDGNFTAALGVPTLDGFGAVGDGAHALHEHVSLDQLAPRAALIAGVLARLVRSGDPARGGPSASPPSR